VVGRIQPARPDNDEEHVAGLHLLAYRAREVAAWGYVAFDIHEQSRELQRIAKSLEQCMCVSGIIVAAIIDEYLHQVLVCSKSRVLEKVQFGADLARQSRPVTEQNCRPGPFGQQANDL